MSPRFVRRTVAVLAFLAACSGAGTEGTSHHKPGAAAERARAEAKASGEIDPSDDGKSWGGWRYSGARDDCFFVVGQRCFSEREAACKAAACKDGSRCRTEGGGPATVVCK
jgi:hypothetical protein